MNNVKASHKYDDFISDYQIDLKNKKHICLQTLIHGHCNKKHCYSDWPVQFSLEGFIFLSDTNGETILLLRPDFLNMEKVAQYREYSKMHDLTFRISEKVFDNQMIVNTSFYVIFTKRKI